MATLASVVSSASECSAQPYEQQQHLASNLKNTIQIDKMLASDLSYPFHTPGVHPCYPGEYPLGPGPMARACSEGL